MPPSPTRRLGSSGLGALEHALDDLQFLGAQRGEINLRVIHRHPLPRARSGALRELVSRNPRNSLKDLQFAMHSRSTPRTTSPRHVNRTL
jgi:hypothetical protein